MWLCLQSAVLLITYQFIIAEPIVKTCSLPRHFVCENDQCITSACVCDGNDDCGDASDEKNCIDTRLHRPCSAEEFQCADKLCIPRERVCDGTIHCLDKSDEHKDCTKNGNLDESGAGTRCLSFPHCHTNIQTVIVNGVNIPSDGHKAEAGGKQKKFKLYSERVNWHGAILRCAINGMALASIESEEEQNEVKNLIKQTDTTNCKDELYCNRWWLGSSDLHDYGNYSWYSNGRPLSYRHFRKGEPNAKKIGPGTIDCLDDEEHCVEIIVGPKYDKVWDYEWNDILCTDRLYFVCEYFD